MNKQLAPIVPTAPVAPLLGGKRSLASRNTALLDAAPHSTYAKPFVGIVASFCATGCGRNPR